MPRDLRREVRVNWILTGIWAVVWLAMLVFAPSDIDGIIGLGAFVALMALLSWHHAHQVKRGRQPWGVPWEKLQPVVIVIASAAVALVVVLTIWGLPLGG